MNLTSHPYNVVDFVNHFQKGELVINKDYQRDGRVWSPKARSFLIETILRGFPIPKLILSQKTDIKKLKTTKEIVDGQQRTVAIVDFMNNLYPLSSDASPEEVRGHYFEDLNESFQQKFCEYALSYDLLVGATDENIREMFRRINAYTAPLNYEEQRHARFQGEFKWFINELSQRHTGFLQAHGAFSERKIVRMKDAKLFTEVCYFAQHGIETTKSKQLDQLYAEFENLENKKKEFFADVIERGLAGIADLEEVSTTGLIKKDAILNLLIVAMAHQVKALPSVSELYKFKHKKPVAVAGDNMAFLASALELDEEDVASHPAAQFAAASASGTNVKEAREIRFKWLCRALDDESLNPK